MTKNSYHLKYKSSIQAAKEKALQIERKRKAAQFLAQLAERKPTVSTKCPQSELIFSSLLQVSSVTAVETLDSSTEDGELVHDVENNKNVSFEGWKSFYRNNLII